MRQGKVYRRCTRCGGDVNAKRRQPDRPATHEQCDGTRSTWAYVVDLAPPGAKRRQVTKAGFPTKTKALDAMNERQTDTKRGTAVERSRETVGQYLARWLKAVRGEYRPGTWDTASIHVERYIAPRALAEMPLQAVTRTDVRTFLAELAEHGRIRGDVPLSRKTVHNVYRTLCRALNDAVEDRLRPDNPAAGAHKLPESPPQATWTAEQLRMFYASVAADRWFALWRLAGSTGMRRGELAGIRWSDLDLDARRVNLVEQHAKGGGTVSRQRLKGKRGRTIDLDAETVAALKSWRKRQAVERLAWPGEWGNEEDLVFAHEDGKALHPDSITKLFRRRVVAAGLPIIKTHGLRHTHASLMLAAGVPLKIVQERLGHASIAVTGDVYSHVTPGLQAEAAARVAAMIDGE
jgi:integrase